MDLNYSISAGIQASFEVMQFILWFIDVCVVVFVCVYKELEDLRVSANFSHFVEYFSL